MVLVWERGGEREKVIEDCWGLGLYHKLCKKFSHIYFSNSNSLFLSLSLSPLRFPPHFYMFITIICLITVASAQNVIELTIATFEETLQNNFAFLLFHSSSTIKTMFEQLSIDPDLVLQSHQNIIFASIDCEAEQKICSSFDILRFPSYLAYDKYEFTQLSHTTTSTSSNLREAFEAQLQRMKTSTLRNTCTLDPQSLSVCSEHELDYITKWRQLPPSDHIKELDRLTAIRDGSKHLVATSELMEYMSFRITILQQLLASTA